MSTSKFWWGYWIIGLLTIAGGALLGISEFFQLRWFHYLLALSIINIIFFVVVGIRQWLLKKRGHIPGWMHWMSLIYILGTLILLFHGTTHLVNGGFLKATCGISDSAFYYQGYYVGREKGYDKGLEECVDKANRAIDSLQTLLDNCQTGKVTKKPVTTKKTTVRKPTTKKKPLQTKKEVFSPPPKELSGGFQDSMSVDMTKYGPIFSGDYGTTTSIDLTSPEAYLMYYLSDEAFQKAPKTISVPRVHNQEMISYSYQGKKYWILINYDERLTSELITGSQFYNWSIYIGEFQGKGFSYPMYWPHEAIKGLMQKVRGREDGEVTQSDLQEMGKYNPGIAKGTIRPNNIFVDDYEGWEFYTRINYVVRE